MSVRDEGKGLAATGFHPRHRNLEIRHSSLVFSFTFIFPVYSSIRVSYSDSWWEESWAQEKVTHGDLEIGPDPTLQPYSHLHLHIPPSSSPPPLSRSLLLCLSSIRTSRSRSGLGRKLGGDQTEPTGFHPCQVVQGNLKARIKVRTRSPPPPCPRPRLPRPLVLTILLTFSFLLLLFFSTHS